MVLDGYLYDRHGDVQNMTANERACMNQKDAVYSVVCKVLGRQEFSSAVKLEKVQRAKVIDQLTKMFTKGRLAVENEQEDLRQYCGGLTSNWLRKDPRLNGNKKHVPQQGAIGRPKKNGNGTKKVTKQASAQKASSQKTVKPKTQPIKQSAAKAFASTVAKKLNITSTKKKYAEVEELYGKDKQVSAMLNFMSILPSGSPDIKIVEAKLEARLSELRQSGDGKSTPFSMTDLPKELHVIAQQYAQK